MAKYYYNKYAVSTSQLYRINRWRNEGIDNNYDFSMWHSYSFDVNTGKFTGVGSKTAGVGPYTSGTAYDIWSTGCRRYTGGYNGSVITASAVVEKYDSESRGSLVQSNIIAENGTYPANGVHTDGYWYVRGSIYYDPPTVPSSITIPNEIKGGESFTISWGASSYQTGYRLERQLDGGAWTQIVEQVGRTYSDTVPKGTSTVNYRVRSYGSGGASGYRTGTQVNVINFPEIFENFNGTYVAYEGAWENVNGTWVEIDSVWENVNGVWVEL